MLPLVSALQMQALVEIVETGDPKLFSVIRHSLAALMAVIAAEIMAGICIVFGLFALILPGFYIAIRLAVVAPTAAFERRSWMDSLRDAWEMTYANFWRTFGLLAVLGIIAGLIGEGVETVLSGADSVTTVVVITIFTIVLATFRTLAVSVLYFDLRARESMRTGGGITRIF